MLERLLQLRDMGLSPTAILVVLFIEERGEAPAGLMAKYLSTAKRRVAPRTVEDALKQIREAGVLSPQKNADIDHGYMENREKGTAQEVAAPGAAFRELSDADPLVAGLKAQGIFGGAAVNLIRRHGRERVAQQLEHHAERLAKGFEFKLGHKRVSPGRFLYLAIEGDYAPMWTPPPGLIEAQRQKRQEEEDLRANQLELGRRHAAAEQGGPEPEQGDRPVAEVPTPVLEAITPTVRTVMPTASETRPMSLETAKEWMVKHLRSPIAHFRQQGLAIAEQYGFDPRPYMREEDRIAAV